MDGYDLAKDLLTKGALWASRAFAPYSDRLPYQSVVIQGLSVLTTVITPAQQLYWPSDGMVVGVRATPRDGTLGSMAGMLLRIVVDGGEELFPSGSGAGGGYITYAQCSAVMQVSGYPVTRPVRQSTSWQVYVQNTTGGTVVSDIAFDFVSTRNPRLGT